MRSMMLVASLLFAGGCLPVHPSEPVKNEPVVDENKFRDMFGDVPIIQHGMSMEDVERLVGPDDGEFWTGGSTFCMYECGLDTDSFGGKVTNCSYRPQTVTGARETIADSTLETMLRPDLSPRAVEAKIGQPSCGFCNKPGNVTLLYRQPGIAVEFVDGRLLRWRRVVTYKDEPAPSS